MIQTMMRDHVKMVKKCLILDQQGIYYVYPELIQEVVYMGTRTNQLILMGGFPKNPFSCHLTFGQIEMKAYVDFLYPMGHSCCQFLSPL
jgi:hypothetical protein